MSLRELAAAVGTNHASIGNWEQGYCRPRPESALRLLEVLGEFWDDAPPQTDGDYHGADDDATDDGLVAA